MAQPTRSEGSTRSASGAAPGSRPTSATASSSILRRVVAEPRHAPRRSSGMPRDLDLEGRDAARRSAFDQIAFDHPAFEARLGRSRWGDPGAGGGVRPAHAVDRRGGAGHLRGSRGRRSARRAWCSLRKAPGRVVEVLVLARGGRGSAGSSARRGGDGALLTLEEPVAAVDYRSSGAPSRRSRRSQARRWRSQRVSRSRAAAVARTQLRVGGAVTLADALVLEAWARVRKG